jgi:hypothetical protein
LKSLVLTLFLVGAVQADEIIYRCQSGSRVEYQQLPCKQVGTRESILSQRTMRGTVNVYRVADTGYKSSPPAPAAPEPAGGEGRNHDGTNADLLAARQAVLANGAVSRTLLASKADSASSNPTPAENTQGGYSTMRARLENFIGWIWSGLKSAF